MQTIVHTPPSLLPNAPPLASEPLHVTRLRMKLRETLDANRRLQREATMLRQELQNVRTKLRRRATA